MDRTIGQILRSIPQMDRDTLMSAFNEGLSSYVEYSPGRYLGVNTDSIPYLTCVQTAGDWREGTINRVKAQA